eukprot:GHRR01023115.1.p1 GENE.GHRR01023115.1~~GHRR01023115.1.p1  ORF type:complete len:386 (+),score=77.62 GHRR01023115.1:698-1855(+)
MATVVPEGPLPEPGQVVQLDLRPTCGYRQTAETVKLLQWNIERGYQLDTVIEQLRQADADILSLQEVDIGCQRSGRKDTGRLIAEALRLSYIFICEFVELFSDLRNARSQGGGVHGNAILSKYPITSYSIIEHSHHPIDWNALPESQPHPLAAQEPRRGRRLTLAADISTPQGLLRVYNCHLEVPNCHVSHVNALWQQCITAHRSNWAYNSLELSGTINGLYRQAHGSCNSRNGMAHYAVRKRTAALRNLTVAWSWHNLMVLRWWWLVAASLVLATSYTSSSDLLTRGIAMHWLHQWRIVCIIVSDLAAWHVPQLEIRQSLEIHMAVHALILQATSCHVHCRYSVAFYQGCGSFRTYCWMPGGINSRLAKHSSSSRPHSNSIVTT